jgi:hypothetical protein
MVGAFRPIIAISVKYSNDSRKIFFFKERRQKMQLKSESTELMANEKNATPFRKKEKPNVNFRTLH